MPCHVDRDDGSFSRHMKMQIEQLQDQLNRALLAIVYGPDDSEVQSARELLLANAEGARITEMNAVEYEMAQLERRIKSIEGMGGTPNKELLDRMTDLEAQHGHLKGLQRKDDELIEEMFGHMRVT